MFELLVTLCIGGDPSMCMERRVPLHEQMNMMRCMRHGMNHAQRYADGYPDMDLKRWRCITDEPEPEAAAAFLTEEIAPGVFVHTGRHETPTPHNKGDLANVGFIVGEEAVAVVDAGGTAEVGEALLAAIRARTDLPIRYLILTHMHPDHVLGAKVFADEGAEIVGHVKLDRALKARAQTYTDNIRRLVGDEAFAGSEIVLPDSGVEGTREIDLGGRMLLLEAHPTAHTDNDLTVLDRATGTWFLGDLLFSGHCPALDGSIIGWRKLLGEFRGRDVARIVPGHGPASMKWPDGADALGDYLETLAKETRAAIAEGRTMSDAVRSVARDQEDRWLLFEEFHPRNVTAAYQELEWE